MVDGGGYDPKRRGAPASSAPAQAYTAPVQSFSAPAAAPMASAPASKWEPCALPSPTFSLPSLFAQSLSYCRTSTRDHVSVYCDVLVLRSILRSRAYALILSLALSMTLYI